MIFFLKGIHRECCLNWRQLHVNISVLLFYCMVLVFFPLSFPPDPQLLHQLFPGLVWIAILFSLFLAAERLFTSDLEAGVLEQWFMDKNRLYVCINAKLFANWLMSLVPMCLFCPVLMLMFGLSVKQTLVLVLFMTVGTPTIFLCCALAAAFSTGLQQKSTCMALIVLPLALPVMILGSGGLAQSMQGLPVSGELALLLALSLLSSLVLAPVIAMVLRVNIGV